jgi:hypothetical protein
MKIIWCKDLEDVVNIARTQGWLFFVDAHGKHYYYVYASTEPELLCLAVEAGKPLKAKYVSIDDDGNIKTSDKPIMPTCAKVVNVAKDEGFEELLKQSLG